ERARREADNLDVLSLLGGRDDRRGRDVAVAQLARHRVAYRTAATRPGDDAGHIEPVILEKPFFQGNAVRRSGRIVLVLSDDEINRAGGSGRSDAERHGEDDAFELHSAVSLRGIPAGAPGLPQPRAPSAIGSVTRAAACRILEDCRRRPG